MNEEMRRGYVEAGGQKIAIVIGGLLGLVGRTALQTAVVVLVIRALGVL